MKTNNKLVKRLLSQHKSTWYNELEQLAHIDYHGLMSTKSYIDGLHDSLQDENFAVRAVAAAKLRMLKAK